jgi:RNase P/RNase MRP subunit p30
MIIKTSLGRSVIRKTLSEENDICANKWVVCYTEELDLCSKREEEEGRELVKITKLRSSLASKYHQELGRFKSNISTITAGFVDVGLASSQQINQDGAECM